MNDQKNDQKDKPKRNSDKTETPVPTPKAAKFNNETLDSSPLMTLSPKVFLIINLSSREEHSNLNNTK